MSEEIKTDMLFKNRKKTKPKTSNPEYNHMTPTNLNTREKLIKLFANHPFGTALVLVATVGTIVAAKHFLDPSNEEPKPSIDKETFFGNDETDNSQPKQLEEKQIIGTEEMDDAYVIFVGDEDSQDLVDTCSSMLETIGIDNEETTMDNLVETVQKAMDVEPEIIVFNVESGSGTEVTIRLNVNNDEEFPSDSLAMCVDTELNEIGYTPEIVAGKKNKSGRTIKTETEDILNRYDLDVMSYDMSVASVYSSDEKSCSELAESITKSFVRYLHSDKDERKEKQYYVPAYGDTISEIAEKYNVDQSYLKKQTGDFLLQGEPVRLRALRPVTAGPNVKVVLPTNFYTSSKNTGNTK